MFKASTQSKMRGGGGGGGGVQVAHWQSFYVELTLSHNKVKKYC